MAVYLFNCKHCKLGRRVEYPVKLPHGEYRRGSAGELIAPGIWPVISGVGRIASMHPGEFAVRRGQGVTVYDGDPLGLCDGCGRAMTYGRLQGRVVPSVPCNAKCANSRGFICDCSCGGKHHGAGWGVAYREAA